MEVEHNIVKNVAVIWLILATLYNLGGGVFFLFAAPLMLTDVRNPELPVNWFTQWGIWTVPGIAVFSVIISWVLFAMREYWPALLLTFLPFAWWIGLFFTYANYHDATQ